MADEYWTRPHDLQAPTPSQVHYTAGQIQPSLRFLQHLEDKTGTPAIGTQRAPSITLTRTNNNMVTEQPQSWLPIPCGSQSPGVSQAQHPWGPANEDDHGNVTDKGLYIIFAFKDKELLMSMGTQTALASIDSGLDLNIISKHFLDSLPVCYKKCVVKTKRNSYFWK